MHCATLFFLETELIRADVYAFFRSLCLRFLASPPPFEDGKKNMKAWKTLIWTGRQLTIRSRTVKSNTNRKKSSLALMPWISNVSDSSRLTVVTNNGPKLRVIALATRVIALELRVIAIELRVIALELRVIALELRVIAHELRVVALQVQFVYIQ